MLILKRKPCKNGDGRLSAPGRRKCFRCLWAEARAKREAKAIRERSKAHKARQKALRVARREREANSYKVLHRKAWDLFSRHIRGLDKKDYELVKCFTCDVIITPENAHAGHYLHGRLDFDTRNVHIQCPKCNTFLHGNLGVYAEKLIAEGIDLKQLRRDAEEKHYTCQELREIIATLSK